MFECRAMRPFNILDSYDCSFLSSDAALLEFKEERGKIELLPEEIEEKLDTALPQNGFRLALRWW
jgi:hypothetical protein